MKCPGQDSRFWKPGDIFETRCPACGAEVEFFKDDTARRCPRCGRRFVNPKMDFGCAAYCPYAEQCLGDLPAELVAEREELLKDRVAVAMKRYFKKDFRRIGHAGRVARYAEEIGQAEKGSLAVILTTAYLHDIGLIEAERLHPSQADQYHEETGPAVARQILEGLGARAELIDEVAAIIGRHHRPGPDDSLSFKVVYDADRIVNMEEALKAAETEDQRQSLLQRIREKPFLTAAGQEVAGRVLGM
jgi:DNA-directed RNA polymerase subunit RPC12/RpoP/chorismate mutase